MIKKVFKFLKNIYLLIFRNLFFKCFLKINFDYFIEKNNLKLNFNKIARIDKLSGYRFFFINNKIIKYSIFYFDKIDFPRIQEKTCDNDIFIIQERIFKKSINKIIISLLINGNAKIYIAKDSEIKLFDFCNFKKMIKISLLHKLFSDKQKIFKMFSTFIINLCWRANKKDYFQNFFITYNKLIGGKNILRVGDGEIMLLSNYDSPFQEYNSEIKHDLNKSICYFSNKNQIALNKKIGKYSNIINDRNNFQDFNVENNLKFNDCVIYDANIFSITPYILYKKEYEYLDKPLSFFLNKKIYSIFNKEFYIYTDIGKKSLDIYNKFFFNFFDTLSKKKNLIFLMPDFHNFFTNECFFKRSKNIEIINVPEINAYLEKNKILNKIKNLLIGNDLIILSCGPLAKIICHWLDQNNIHFIDIGNFPNYYYYYNGKINSINDLHNIKYIKSINNNNNFYKKENIYEKI